jgi:hypothetical protein
MVLDIEVQTPFVFAAYVVVPPEHELLVLVATVRDPAQLDVQLHWHV